MLPIARDTESERKSVVESLPLHLKRATHGPSEPPDQDPPYDRLAGFVPPVTKVPQKPGNELGMRESGRMAAAEAWIEYVEIQFNSI